MVVDDEPAIVRVATRSLARFGYQVTGYTSSLEALAAFHADPGAFDLVITDLTMPDPTGDVLAKAIREVRPDIPIVICTGFGEGVDAVRARAVGIDAYASKPYTADALAAVVRRVLDLRNGANRRGG
jgi:CheY-like chemotaxis protein